MTRIHHRPPAAVVQENRVGQAVVKQAQQQQKQAFRSQYELVQTTKQPLRILVCLSCPEHQKEANQSILI